MLAMVILKHKRNTHFSFSLAEGFRPLEMFHSCENDSRLGNGHVPSLVLPAPSGIGSCTLWEF